MKINRSTPPITIKLLRSPNGTAGVFHGWYTFARGAVTTRRTALRVLVFGPCRARIETAQSNNPNFWEV